MKRSAHGRFVCAVTLTVGLGIATADAGSLMDRIETGDSIRIGFANEIPWAYPGENNEPKGFVNAYTLAVLKKMSKVGQK